MICVVEAVNGGRPPLKKSPDRVKKRLLGANVCSKRGLFLRAKAQTFATLGHSLKFDDDRQSIACPRTV